MNTKEEINKSYSDLLFEKWYQEYCRTHVVTV